MSAGGRRNGDGYFPPDSVIRRVAGATLVHVLRVAPTVLYQAAHPLVAVGIVEHANYRGEHWRRWRNVLRASFRVVFGTRTEADRAAEGIHHAHSRIRGTTTERLGPFPAGTTYSADDPELLFWVTTSLIEVTSRLYGRYVRRLSFGEQERYYADMCELARILGVTDEAIPRTFADYRVELDERLAEEVSVTRHARAIATAILRGPLPLHFRLTSPAHRLACAGLLPPGYARNTVSRGAPPTALRSPPPRPPCESVLRWCSQRAG